MTHNQFIIGVIIIFVLFFAMICISATVCRPPEAPDNTLYANCGTVTAIDRENNSVTFTDSIGHAWMFSGVEDWQLGDTVAAIMNDNGTANVTDDIIVSVRYCG